LYGIFLAPLFAVLLFNTVIFIMVTAVLIKHTRKKLAKDSKKKKEVTQGTVKAIISVFSVMVMFGLSWLFGALSIDEGALFFQWPFIILNTLQGFFLFIFFCVIGKDAREEWLNLLSCYRRKKKQKQSTASHSRSSQVPKSTSTKYSDLTTRYAQSYTIRRSVGLLPEPSQLDSDSKAPLDQEMSDIDNLKSIAEEEDLVIANGSAVIEETKVDLSVKSLPEKPRRKKTSSQLPPHIQFKLKRPFYHVVVDQEESIPASSPVQFKQKLTPTSDINVFTNLTDDSTTALIIDSHDLEYSVV
jgi:hypothetical protein